MTDLPRSDIDPDGLLEYSVVFTDRSLNHMSQRFIESMQSLLTILRDTYAAQAVALVPGGGSFAMAAVGDPREGPDHRARDRLPGAARRRHRPGGLVPRSDRRGGRGDRGRAARRRLRPPRRDRRRHR